MPNEPLEERTVKNPAHTPKTHRIAHALVIDPGSSLNYRIEIVCLDTQWGRGVPEMPPNFVY
jgi:hypothetical protein